VSPLRSLTALASVAGLLGATVLLGASATSATPATSVTPFVECPRVEVGSDGPPESPMPTHEPDFATVGGALLGTSGLAVPRLAPGLPHTLSARSWIVADLDSGAVLGACGAHVFGAPASVQKLLLAQTVMPKLDPDEIVTITDEDLNFEPGSSAVGLIEGGKYTVEDLWLGLFLNSGNDAANTLARLGGGARGVAGTLADMNSEAKRLGALETHVETPSGLDGPGQATSAYDLALITRALFARDDFRRYVSTKLARLPAQPPAKGYEIQNDNQLLFQYPGALGGKTGFTDIARHTFVGLAERDGRRLVVTLLGAEHQPVMTWEQGAALLDWGFSVPADASVGQLVAPQSTDARAVAAHVPRDDVAASPGALAATGSAGPKVSAAMVGAAALTVITWVAIFVADRRRRRRS
jgi:serine-type D-Ala-D-Ala carboxypeptidase (penicillin-binding protein 5/6)